MYCKEERSLLFLVHEDAQEKAYGAGGMDLSSSGGYELKYSYIPRNSLLGRFSNDVKVCFGFYLTLSLFSRHLKKIMSHQVISPGPHNDFIIHFKGLDHSDENVNHCKRLFYK
jgi:hypothetical protein